MTTAHTPVNVAAHTMATRRLRLLCVTDSAGPLIGVLTRPDLPRLYLRAEGVIQANIEADTANALADTMNTAARTLRHSLQSPR
jgi:CBS domain-containing protein